MSVSCRTEPPPSPLSPIPRLAVLLVVDQMRADYLDRFRPLFRGGLKRLLDEGLVYTQTRHDHACTQTASGHATLSTGVHPARHGIIGNYWYERETGAAVASVEDDRTRTIPSGTRGSSPARLEAAALADWLRERHPAAKILSLSDKDRSAILLGGRAAKEVYWFDESSGVFVTSTYYHGAIPAWMAAINARRPTEPYRDRPWDRIHPDPAVYALATRDDFPEENHGVDNTFPHRPPPPEKGDAAYYTYIEGTPWMDEILLDAAREGIRALGLGKDDVPDLLAISLTPTDKVGHMFGPNSQEMEDQILRLDLTLGRFLDDLAAGFGPSELILALTSDHGIVPLPLDLRERGFPGRDLGEPMKRDIDALNRELQTEYGGGEYVLQGGFSELYLNRTLLNEKRIDPDVLTDRVAARARGFDWVKAAYTRKELQAAPEEEGTDRTLFRHGCHPSRSGDVLLQTVEYGLVPPRPPMTDNHGTVYDYDRHVPLIFWGLGLKGVVDRRVRTVDVAPTLSLLLRVPPPPDLDGRALPEAMEGLERKEARGSRQ